MRLELASASSEQTGLIGAALGALLEPGDVIALSGPLGAGKTRLVQGIAVGLEVSGRVTSPTFVLVRRHAGRIPLVHADVYRLERHAELDLLDEDLFAADVVSCVEWGDAVERSLPSPRLDVGLALEADARRLTLVPVGTAWEAWLPALGDALIAWRSVA
jgi:tRNA threonylcarbamoyladenosine biosynthesis protein TsaE